MLYNLPLNFRLLHSPLDNGTLRNTAVSQLIRRKPTTLCTCLATREMQVTPWPTTPSPLTWFTTECHSVPSTEITTGMQVGPALKSTPLAGGLTTAISRVLLEVKRQRVLAGTHWKKWERIQQAIFEEQECSYGASKEFYMPILRTASTSIPTHVWT